jgi:RNA polymerase sigma-70 factor, ECF subfamily
LSQQYPQYEAEHDYAAMVAQIANGDQAALSQLYSATNRLIFGLILRILSNRAIAEEVLFEVYAQVWRQAHRYDTARGSALSWMTTMARTRAIDRLRSEKNYQQQDELTEKTSGAPTGDSNPERHALTSELRTQIRAALNSLPAEQREVIEQSYFLGMTQTEIAEFSNLPLGTVKTRTRLAMERLRKSLKHTLRPSLQE